MRKLIASFVMLAFVVGTAGVAQAQSRMERRKLEGEKPKNVSGGVKIQIPQSSADAFDTVLNAIKKADYNIDPAYTSKENGVIITAIAVDPKDRGRSTRVTLTVIEDSKTQSTVKVVVAEQRRSTTMGTGAWGDAKYLEAPTTELAGKIAGTINPGSPSEKK